ncbi:hypothetical protein [Thermococcus paralvinellae]|nr:hypothetical protein [Thermococcus paralvinellae]
MKVIFIVILIVFSTFCIGKNQTQTPTNSKKTQSSIPTQTVPEVKSPYSNWVKNETRYFTIYYPPSVANYEKFMAKIRFLLTGIDYTYESYAKVFGKEPQKLELYIYPSEDDLKLDYSTDLPWYIEGNKIFTFLDKDLNNLYPFTVESALIAYLTGKVNGLTLAFPSIADAYFRSIPRESVSFSDLLKLADSKDSMEIYRYWDNMGDLIIFLISKYGTQEVLKLLQIDEPSQEILKLPNVESEYQKFIDWFWNGGIFTGIGKIEEINLSLKLNEYERFYLANSSIRLHYLLDYYPVFFKSSLINVQKMNTNYLQNFFVVIPFEKRELYFFNYIGNFTIQPITTDEDFGLSVRARPITRNFTVLYSSYLMPIFPTNKLIMKGTIKVESKNQAVISDFPSADILIATGNFKKFTGYVNGTKVNFYYTPAIESPSKAFRDALEAVKFSKGYFIYPKEINIIYGKEIGTAWIFAGSTIVLSSESTLNANNFLWFLRYIFFEKIELKPKDSWALYSIWVPVCGAHSGKFSLEYAKEMYKTILKELPNTDHPLVDFYKYGPSPPDQRTLLYKAHLTTLFISSQAGEKAYREAFMEFSKKYLYKEADFDEFARILAEKSNNPNIPLMWHTWTIKKALPNITVENAQLIKNGNNYTLKLTIVDKNGFAFPFKVEGITWQGRRTETVKAFYTGKPIEIELVFPGQPKELVIYGAPMLDKNFNIEVDGVKISITVP